MVKGSYIFGKYVVKAPEGSRLQKLCAKLKEEFPDLQMGHKREIWYHWVLHVVAMIFTLFFNRTYINFFTTTFKNRVHWGDKHHDRIQTGTDLDRVWECLMHEREHLRQFDRYGMLLMGLMWIIPPFLFCYWRAQKIELPGYTESIRAKFQTSRQWVEHPEYKKWWVKQFTGPNYLWMWIRRKQVEGWFDQELLRLQEAA